MFWHDGKPFTADDVIYSYERIIDPNVDAPHLKVYYKDIKKVEKLDPYTVRSTYAVPYFKALEFCGGLPIVPKHLFDDGGDFNRHPAGRKPIGTGPYRFVSWTTGRKIVLEETKVIGIKAVLLTSTDRVQNHHLKKSWPSKRLKRNSI